jgi:hypothetical protein
MLPLQGSCSDKWTAFKETVMGLKTASDLRHLVHLSGSTQWMPDPCNTTWTLQVTYGDTINKVIGVKNVGRQFEIKTWESQI